MNATVPTGLRVDYDARQSITVNFHKALREFGARRPDAEPTQIRINPKTAFKLNGVKIVLDARMTEGQIEVTGLEGV